ncbi:39S ribosomal protein L46, mitochondrial [Ooceraea biroi]|uniref:Large ribosomal subunit protein mL46 n=1 Tax=Ooceraea biroi TaxID=2015173 RepID=A0A026WTC2_OOCBI|nr:39S ribosomal protein L46, mitochondrial [Ooceraea biroi]
MLKQGLRSFALCNVNQILPGISKKGNTICASVIQPQNVQTLCTAPVVKTWDLYSAVCLERHPIITKPMQEIELKFYTLLKQIELENSMICDYELKVEEKKQLKKVDDNADMDSPLLQTVQDFEDNCQEEFNNFKFAPRITKFDEQNITSSLERKLDQSLLLLVQQKVGNKSYWIPPQGIRKEGETMRQTAERVLQDTCGTEIKAKFYGNAPIGFYKYTYSKKLREQGSYGAKIFYFLAKYVDGSINDNNVKYQWLNHEEAEKILPNDMRKSISQFMIFN